VIAHTMTSPFIGRESEASALVAALAQPGIVTITGAAGIGKTRLATEVGRRDDPVSMVTVFVGLSDAGDSIDVRRAVASAREAVLRENPAWLGPGDTDLPELLILDNAGHIPGIVAEVTALADASRGARIVVTNPGPLGIAGERVLRLGPLAPRGDGDDGNTGPDDAAVELFIDRAAAASVTFRADDADRPTIRAVCDVLDRVPLAIEMAAAQAGAYTPAALLAQLEGGMGLDVLRKGASDDGPDRHRSMRLALEWSYAQLGADARLVLDALSTFRGSFTPAGVAAVTTGLGEAEAFDALSSLVDFHWVEPVATGLAVGRFELLPLIRRFAGERLLATDLADEVERLRTAYIRELAHSAAAAFDRREFASAFAALEHEWPEIADVSARLSTDGDNNAALQLAVDCAPFLFRVGYDAAAHAALERIIDNARRGGVGEALLIRGLLWSAVLTRLMPDRPDPVWIHARLDDAISRARATDDRDALLMGLDFTVLCAAVTGNLAAAAAATAEGLAMAQSEPDEDWLAGFEGLACMVENHRGEPTEAAEFGRLAVSRALRRQNDPALLRAALAVFGLPDAAELAAYQLLPSIDRLLEAARDLHDRHSEMFLLGVEASRLLTIGDDRGAADFAALQLSILVARSETNTVGVGFSNSVLTTIAARRGEHAMAAQLYGSIERLGPAVLNAASPAKRRAYLDALATSEAALGARRWEEERSAGAALSPADAARLGITYARSIVKVPATRRSAEADRPVAYLRPSELEVLRVLVAGKSNKEIAQALQLSPKTVMHYLSAIYKRIGVRGRAAATAWAIRNDVLGE
jgi:predicted ATPase/DNA-binding CsgD family transcriptional regulator